MNCRVMLSVVGSFPVANLLSGAIMGATPTLFLIYYIGAACLSVWLCAWR